MCVLFLRLSVCNNHVGILIRKYLWVVSLFFTVVISYLLARVISLFIAGYFPNVMITTPEETLMKEIARVQEGLEVDPDVILKRNFFDAKETVIKAADEVVSDDATLVEGAKENLPQNLEAVETGLNIKLLSTVSVGNGENPYSSAVVKGESGVDTHTIKSKNPFGTDTKIVRILPKRVEFLNRGRLEFVKLEDFAKEIDLNQKPDRSQIAGVTRVDRDEGEQIEDITQVGDVFKIPRTEVDSALSNMARLYTEMRAVPYFKEGKPQGFKVLSVKNGSLFQKLGLRRGDILKTINGKLLEVQTGLETFSTLKNESEFKLELERRGEDIEYKYEII